MDGDNYSKGEDIMDVELVNPFLDAIVNVLSVMAQTDATAGKPFLKKGDKAMGDVTGIIGLVGDQAKGSLAVSFSEAAILDITSKMLGEEITEMDQTAADMAGEITNMVTGGAKKSLAEKGYKFDLSIPTMIVGKDHNVSHKTAGVVVIIPFDTDAGSFFVEVCFEE